MRTGDFLHPTEPATTLLRYLRTTARLMLRVAFGSAGTASYRRSYSIASRPDLLASLSLAGASSAK